MIRENLKIKNIPAILWGNKSDNLFIAVHGNMSNKEDKIILAFVEEITAKGYQVLSFDLPEHGERKYKTYPCKVQNCVKDLNIIMDYAETLSNNISVFACSMGAYFSLLAYGHKFLKQSLFISPVVNMEAIINNMMTCFGISEDRLEEEKEISTPIGQILYWDYYCYVKEHPVITWNTKTSILYGEDDDLCEFEVISAFTKRFNCDLEIMNKAGHYFHTEKQISFFKNWLRTQIHVKRR